MAADAGCVRGGQVVVAIDVALRALHRRVGAAQREPRRRVIKRRAVPRSRVVALLATSRESRLHVIRIRRAVEILDVAGGAVGGCSNELAIDVALRAGDGLVRSLQRELGKCCVIERCRIPRARVVAHVARGREAGLCMRRIVRLVEICQMASDAGGCRVIKFPARVAGVTIQRSVRSHQRESCELQVIELRAHPVIHGVALCALRRVNSQRDVINARRPRVNEIFLVARVTSCRESLELSHRSALVAGVAIHSRVRPCEREPVHVLVDLLDRNVPSAHGVALLAVGAHLRLVNVRMALAALRSDIREHRLRMTLRTRNAFVHSAQRILCGVVIELRNSANRFPAAQRVTVLTRNAETSVRTPRIRGRLRLRRRHVPGKRRENDRQIK